MLDTPCKDYDISKRVSIDLARMEEDTFRPIAEATFWTSR